MLTVNDVIKWRIAQMATSNLFFLSKSSLYEIIDSPHGIWIIKVLYESFQLECMYII